MARLSVRDLRFLPRRARLLIAVPAIALVVAAFWIAAQFLHPIPPRRIVLAAGPEGSALHRAGERYRELLAEDGVKLDVRVTQGAGENLRQLTEGSPDVDAGFVLAGSAKPAAAESLVNVSNLAYVPLWGLSRRGAGVSTLAQLRGKRVAVGLPESGLNLALAPLLAASGVTEQNTTLLHLSDAEAHARLAAGDIDVLFSPDGPQSPAFVAAAGRADIDIIDLTQAAAFAARFRHVVVLTLPTGSVDLVHNLPPSEITLVGSTLMLVAREDLHPTVIDLLVDASHQVALASGHYVPAGPFPSLRQVDAIVVSEQAVTYARAGPSVLRRYLPLWLADFLQRLFTLAIPVVAVVLPLARLLPGLVDLVLTHRLDACYEALRLLERESESDARPAHDILRDLDGLAARARSMQLPLGYADALFAVRRNIDHVRSLVARRATDAA